MSTGSIQPALTALESIYAALVPLAPNADRLPRPVITIQTKGRRDALGWYWPRQWQNGEPQPLDEINICAEHLAQEVGEIAGTVLHEIVHLSNAADGVKDCSGSQYHNGKFRDRAGECGLAVEKHERFGWAITRLGPVAANRVRDLQIDPDAFRIFRLNAKKRKKAGSRLRKWQCPCGVIARVASDDFDATCNRCGEQFFLV